MALLYFQCQVGAAHTEEKELFILQLGRLSMSQAGNSNLSTARVLGMEGNDCSLIFLPFLSRTYSFKLCHLASGKTKKKEGYMLNLTQEEFGE